MGLFKKKTVIKAYDKEPYPFKGINTGSDMAMISGETVEEILANYKWGKGQYVKISHLNEKGIRNVDKHVLNKKEEK